MKPLGDVERISGIAFGFMASKALFAGLHLGIFDALADGPQTLDELAAKSGTERAALETLLTGLVSLDLVVREDERYRNSEDAELYLVSTSPNYYGDYLRMQIDQQMYPFMQHLPKVVEGKTDEVPYEDYETWMGDPEEARVFSESQHGGSLGPGAVLAKRVDMAGRKSLLDVGGGTGAFSIMMCKRHPEVRAVVLDFPNVAKLGEDLVKDEGLGERIAFLPGNALKVEWPGAQDAVLMSYLCSGVPGRALPELMRRAYAALKPGGLLIVHDFMVDDDRQGPPLAALWALQHMVFTPRAASLTGAQLSALMADAGFEGATVSNLIPGMTKVITALKPATVGAEAESPDAVPA
jgi:SAM-dependent methyltransferase